MYYFMEVTAVNSFRKAEELEAKTLQAAKREATKNQAFYGTTLEIGTEINEEGFLVPESVVAYRKGEGRWQTAK